MLKIKAICDHNIKAMSNCPKETVDHCGINYRSY